MRDPKVVILLFGSGTLVIIRTKVEPQINEAALNVMDPLLELGVMKVPEGESWGQSKSEDEDGKW